MRTKRTMLALSHPRRWGAMTTNFLYHKKKKKSTRESLFSSRRRETQVLHNIFKIKKRGMTVPGAMDQKDS